MKLNRIKTVLVEKDLSQNGLQNNLARVLVQLMHIVAIDNSQT